MENTTPLVSIIIPCYNQAQYLPDALGSVLSQTYMNWECLIVNDGSTDNTEVVAQEWLKKDGRFRYLKKENGGLSSARNAGLRLAAGEYIQLLDSDDLLETNKINYQIYCLSESRAQIDVGVAGYRYFRDSARPEDLLMFGPFNILPEVAITHEDKKDTVKLFARINPMVISSPLYHKSVFQRVGLFDENLGANEDWDFHFRCAEKGIIFQHFGYPKNSKALIRLHDESMSMKKANMIRNAAKFRKKHKSNPVFSAENGMSLEPDFVKLFFPPIVVWFIKKLRGTL